MSTAAHGYSLELNIINNMDICIVWTKAWERWPMNMERGVYLRKRCKGADRSSMRGQVYFNRLPTNYDYHWFNLKRYTRRRSNRRIHQARGGDRQELLSWLASQPDSCPWELLTCQKNMNQCPRHHIDSAKPPFLLQLTALFVTLTWLLLYSQVIFIHNVLKSRLPWQR